MPGPDDQIVEIEIDDGADASPIDESIARLPVVFRETLLLRTHGFSYRKISRLTGVPVATVMSRLARARKRLTRIILASRTGSS